MRRALGLGALILALAGPATALGARADEVVLVRIDPAAPAAERAAVQADLGAVAGRGLPAGWRLLRMPAPVTQAQAERALAGNAAVQDVMLDRPLLPQAGPPPDPPPAPPPDPLVGQQWGLAAPAGIDAQAGWALAPAGPVVVAVTDTSVDIDHPDLVEARWTNPGEVAGNGIDDDDNGIVDDVHGADLNGSSADPGADGDPRPDTPGDQHGTHVAGILAATRDNGIGIAGVAGPAWLTGDELLGNVVITPHTVQDRARLMAVKIGSGGGISTGAAMAGITYAVSMGARVVNASWGGAADIPALCDVVEWAYEQGTVVVAAAGNDELNIDGPDFVPATCPSPGLITVAATTQSGGLLGVSNTGRRTVDLAAPGEAVLSTIPGGGTGPMTGTSMAAPHVSGIAAGILATSPDPLSPDQLRRAVLERVTPVAALAGKTLTGGRAQAAGSAVGALGFDPPDVTPPAAFTPTGPADGAWTTDTTPTLTWAPSDGAVGYRVRLDGQEMGTTTATAWTLGVQPNDGAVRRWTVEAEDAAKNVREAENRPSFRIDATAPTAAKPQSPADGVVLGDATAELVWTPGSDGRSGVAGQRLVIDGKEQPVPAGVDRQKVALADGPHTWRVDTLDVAGNRAQGVTRTLVVDTVAPGDLGLVSPVGGTVLADRRPVLTWSASADAGGLARYEITLDGVLIGGAAPGTTAVRPAADLADGAHRWRVSAVDLAGNRRTTGEASFTVDTTAPPAPALLAPEDGTRPANGALTLRWAPVDDAGAVAEILVDGRVVATVPADAGSARVEVLASAQRVGLRVRDAAGNTGPEASAAIGAPALAAAAGPACRMPARTPTRRVRIQVTQVPGARSLEVGRRRGTVDRRLTPVPAAVTWTLPAGSGPRRVWMRQRAADGRATAWSSCVTRLAPPRRAGVLRLQARG
ncbi:MAG: S8 family serine peptidase [Thermoleophilia bacterium]|nr:S8 family serine peptidase [Thermoleophilia bacterium]